MNKGMKFGIAFVLIGCVVSGAFAAGTAVEKVELEVIEDFAYSYRVAVTAEVEDFLAANGVNTSLDARSVTRQIGDLRGKEVEDPVTGEVYSLGNKLNGIVTSALRAAYQGTTDPLFMEIGQLRWAIQYGE